MQLSTNMSFDSYIDEMMTVIENIDLQLENYDNQQFDELLQLLVYQLSKTTVDWNSYTSNKLKLTYDGSNQGIVELIIDLVKSVVGIIYSSTPKIKGDLDQHIMNMLLYQFSIRLFYRRAGREIDPTLGKIKVDHLIPTIQQKPVKLYNVFKESHVTFMSAKFPNAIMIEEKLDEDNE